MSTPHRQGEPSKSKASVQRKKTTSSTGREDAKMIGQWRIGRTIGKGSSGRVKIAKHAVTGKYAAIKIVPKGLIISSRMSVSEAGARADKVLLGIEREIVIMKLIDHPNVLNLYDVWETSQELYLIMEYVPGGELFDYLVKRGRLPVSEALHYFQQIIHAVDYCHRFNICHRDLKPENLLLDKDKNIKVADFGMAAWEAGERMLETSCGSPHYASPEIVAGKAYHGSSSDIWSCGIILFALLTGRLPFDDDNIRSLLQKVKIGVFEMPDEIKDPARDLLNRMLEKDPEKRITMPDILCHPFFVSRPPRPIPGRQLVDPPSLGEVERPVNSPDEIDADIMGNLKTLWSGATDDEIVAALMSKDKTWEKAIYHLLIKYRNKHLENYNMDDEDDVEARAQRQARKAVPGSQQAKRKGVPQPSQRPRLEPLGENETIQDRAPSPVARPQAPTPKKAAGGAMEKLAPVRPTGPRPPLSPHGSTYSDSAHQTPAIVLQNATPTKDLMPPPAVPSRPRSMEPTSPVTEVPTTPLNVPQVQDERLQHFFNEVANQLNTMNIRSSVASGSSSTNSAILGSDYQAYLAYASGAVPAIAQNDPNQFADADDDETVELASMHSSFAMSPMPGQQSPLMGLGIGGPPPPSHGGRPGLYPANNTQRWSYASSAGSSQYRGTSGGSYAIESPQLHTQPTWEAPAPLQAQRPAPMPPPRTASRAPPPRPISTHKPIEREGSYVVIDGSDLPSPEVASWASRHSTSTTSSFPRGQDAFGRLKKRAGGKKVTIDPVPYSAEMAGPATNSFGHGLSSSAVGPSPKRSWFNNLFSFKPASCTLLSHDNVGNTRDRTKRALGELGVQVTVVEIDGLRALKCRLEEIRDPQGTMTVVKGVRFKVEFSRSSQNSNGGYNTLVSFTQEKGAQSSFKNIFAQLKSSFEDSSVPPTPTSAPAQIHTFALPSGQHQPSKSPMLSAPTTRYTTSAPSTPMMPSTPVFETNTRMTPGSVQLPPAIRF
ncbi:hypothetical protein BCR39DRAFT_517417 [Naematelia encephala]|uniref:non-specific serine/threonine protein kinase n=1 Tax=Naematelia encephala TaxID=71784 RepID=A0A1Y2BI80_9TREE|nr:hypothetical protein BCR39DRAFT_517417 [Naematelia encephala]